MAKKIIGFAGGAFINVDKGPLFFFGPAIRNLTLIINEEMTPRDFSGLFRADNPVTFSIVGDLPDGLSLSEEGVLSGTPTVLGTTIGLRIEADDGDVQAQSNAFAITVREPRGIRGVGGGEVGSAEVSVMQSVGSEEVVE